MYYAQLVIFFGDNIPELQKTARASRGGALLAQDSDEHRLALPTLTRVPFPAYTLGQGRSAGPPSSQYLPPC